MKTYHLTLHPHAKLSLKSASGLLTCLWGLGWLWAQEVCGQEATLMGPSYHLPGVCPVHEGH